MKTHLEISSSSILANLDWFAGRTKKPLIFVVKGNAYGHGLEEIVSITRTHPALAYFAVDSADEALRVKSRSGGKPVLAVGWIPEEELPQLLAAGIELIAPSIPYLKTVSALARKQRLQAKIHLKVETGTSRLGIEAEKIPATLAGLNPALIQVKGIYSHFANIEDTTDHAYARSQLELFKRLLARIEAGKLLKHFSCSASALLFPETYFDLVRVGISAYGFWPSKPTQVSFQEQNQSGPVRLKPVLSWYSRVAQVKELPKNAPIGYGLSYRTLKKTRLAVIPVGYFEGYDRRLSNNGWLVVGGKRAPLRGRVCMNMLMADISHVSGVKPGDRVTLIGGQGDERVSAEELAEICQTIHYEIIARINPLIPRVVTP
jgi:alanine racemase